MPEPLVINTLADFMDWIEDHGGRNMLYRGLSDEDYPVNSSISRRLGHTKNGVIPPEQLKKAVQNLLNDAEMRGHRQRNGNTPMRDLELLAELQHYGAATCLIDFTKMPLAALWFACQTESDKNGKVVAVDSGNPEQFITIRHDSLGKTIEKLLPPKDDESGNPVNKFWIWEPHHQNHRITAQRSVFLFGHAPEVPPDGVHNICIVAKNAKAKIVKELRQQGISAASLFCDFDGFARLNAHDKAYPHLSARDYFELGQANATAEKHESAIAYYDCALENGYPRQLVYRQRGWSKFMSKDYQGTVEDLNKAESEGMRNDADLLFWRGISKIRIGDFDGAMKDADKMIAINPNEGLAYFIRGIVKNRKGDKESARANFWEANRLNPKLKIPEEFKKESSEGGGN